MNRASIAYDFGKKLKSLFIFLFFLFITPSVKGQILASLPDSLQKVLAKVPESQHDSLYLKIGGASYLKFTSESLSLALECYKKCLTLAEKYNHKALIAEAHQRIGSVYDANATNPELMLYFFKKAYDLSEGLPDSVRIDYAYCVAVAHNILRDTVQAIYYLEIMKKIGYRLYKKGTEEWDNFNLQLANTMSRMGRSDLCGEIMEQVNKERKYKNGRFPYLQYFLYCATDYYCKKKEYDKAIKILTGYLEDTNCHDPSIAATIANVYREADKYKEAFHWMLIHEDWNSLKGNEQANKDLSIKYLKTENEFKEKERLFEEKQNQYLIFGLCFALIAVGVSMYFWYTNYKSNIKLAKSNHEKTLLIHEVHHRVKNNVQLLYSLAKLQLPNIKDDIARELWLKNLSQLNGMALVNEKLYNTEGVTSFELKEFIPEILAHYKQFQGETDKTVLNINIANNLNVRADFAIPFGLILSELVTNSYKHALKYENPKIDISVLRKSEKSIEFNYTDYGQIADTHIIFNKKTGGSALIRDLVRQLKGKILITNDNHLKYNFSLPI